MIPNRAPAPKNNDLAMLKYQPAAMGTKPAADKPVGATPAKTKAKK